MKVNNIRIALICGCLFLFLFACSSSPIGQKDTQIALYACADAPILEWDPSTANSKGLVVLHNIYETLLRYEPDTKTFTPVLATDYTYSEDKKLWTFYLREKVTFHDGTEMNADAVKFSIERTKELGRGSSFIWDPVEEIRVVDNLTVEFVLSYPADLDMICSSSYAAFIYSPSSVYSHDETWFSSGNESGTGPYKLSYSKQGEVVLLNAYSDYWGGWMPGHSVLQIVVRRMSDPEDRKKAILSGEASVVTELPAKYIEELLKDDRVEVSVRPSYGSMILSIDHIAIPDARVRQALSYAFPYNDASNLMGRVARKSIGFIPEGIAGYNPSMFQYEENLDKARQLLEEAGVDKLTLTAAYSEGDDDQRQILKYYQSNLKEIGVKLNIQSMLWQNAWELAKDRTKHNGRELLMMRWYPEYNDPYCVLYNFFHKQANTGFNISFYENAAFDSLIDSGHRVFVSDMGQAETLLGEAQKLLLSDAAAIFIAELDSVCISTPSLFGVQNNTAYPGVVFFYETMFK